MLIILLTQCAFLSATINFSYIIRLTLCSMILFFSCKLISNSWFIVATCGRDPPIPVSEFDGSPKYHTISELLKVENEPPELSPGKMLSR
jgi:hypothetical protein